MTIHMGPNEWQVLEARILGEEVRARCGVKMKAHRVECIGPPVDGALLCGACVKHAGKEQDGRITEPKFIREVEVREGENTGGTPASSPPTTCTPDPPSTAGHTDHNPQLVTTTSGVDR